MNKAHVKLVVDCCQDEYIRNMLPSMFTDLEKSQKALDGYLDAKRGKFPRFYFLSNLLILAQDLDREQVQDCCAKSLARFHRLALLATTLPRFTISSPATGVMDVEQTHQECVPGQAHH